jgi:hypothetical protein
MIQLKHTQRPILEVLQDLRALQPIKICYNDKVLYNDHDSNEEIEPGIYGELWPPLDVVPARLQPALDKYEVLVSKLDIRIVDHHHCIVYMYGDKIKKETVE